MAGYRVHYLDLYWEFGFTAIASSALDKNVEKRGVFTISGRAYRLVKIENEGQ